MRHLLLTVLALSASLAQEAAPPTAEQILDRYVEVTGGKDAYEKVKSMTMTGTVEIKGQGIKGEIRAYRADGGKQYTIIDLPGIGKQEEGSDGNTVWDKTVLGPRIKTGVEKFLVTCAKSALSEYGKGSLEKDSCYAKVDFVAEEVIDGKPAYHLRLTPKQGRAEDQYFDKQSGLLVRTRVVMPSPMGEVPITSTVSEYREIEGIKTPVKVTNDMGAVAMVMSLNEVKFNAVIPEQMFNLPPEIDALVKSGKK